MNTGTFQQEESSDVRVAALLTGGPLVVLNHDNGDISRFFEDAADDITKAVLWGGSCLNGAESAVSFFLMKRTDTLESFVFLPEIHKGGRMVRPHYFHSDRGSTQQFPNLHTLGYYEDCGSPRDVLWITPQLKTLYVFSRPGRKIHQRMLERWNVVGQHEAAEDPLPRHHQRLPERVWEDSPELEEIVVAEVKSGSGLEFRVLRRLEPPRPLPWEKLRLLEIVLRKESQHKNPKACPFSMLPVSVVDHIVSFCHLGKWKITDE